MASVASGPADCPFVEVQLAVGRTLLLPSHVSFAKPTTPAVVHCKSPDGKYRVDLEQEGTDPFPRTARVLIDGREPTTASEGVGSDNRWPSPGALTCSMSENAPTSGCYVPRTSDYGYIVDVSFDAQGKRVVELRRNGAASEFLAKLACDA